MKRYQTLQQGIIQVMVFSGASELVYVVLIHAESAEFTF